MCALAGGAAVGDGILKIRDFRRLNYNALVAYGHVSLSSDFWLAMSSVENLRPVSGWRIHWKRRYGPCLPGVFQRRCTLVVRFNL